MNNQRRVQQRIPQRASRTQEYPAHPGRAGFHAGTHPEDQPYVSGDLAAADDEEDYPTKTHTSTRRYLTTHGQEVIEQGNRRVVVHYENPPHQRRKLHWAAIFGVGMTTMVLLVVGWTLVTNWWQEHQLDATYGFPRTFQMDAVVYPGDTPQHPTHYIFLNLSGTVEIIELPHGDPQHAHIYKSVTLFEDNADLVPVTGEIKEVAGREEMIVHIADQEIIYINNGKAFVPQQ